MDALLCICHISTVGLSVILPDPYLRHSLNTAEAECLNISLSSQGFLFKASPQLSMTVMSSSV